MEHRAKNDQLDGSRVEGAPKVYRARPREVSDCAFMCLQLVCFWLPVCTLVLLMMRQPAHAWKGEVVLATSVCICSIIAVVVGIIMMHGSRYRKRMVVLACCGVVAASVTERLAVINECFRQCAVADVLGGVTFDQARRIVAALHGYAQDNDGRLPPGLCALIQDGRLKPEELWIQSSTAGACDYAYVVGLRYDRDPGDWIVAFARQDEPYGTGGIAIFLGGEVCGGVSPDELSRYLDEFRRRYVESRGKQPTIIEPRSDKS